MSISFSHLIVTYDYYSELTKKLSAWLNTTVWLMIVTVIQNKLISLKARCHSILFFSTLQVLMIMGASVA